MIQGNVQSQLAQQVLSHIQSMGVDLKSDQIGINADDNLVQIVFRQQDDLGNSWLILMVIAQDDSDWTVMCKKLIQVTLTNRGNILNYVNDLNANELVVTTYAELGEQEPGLIARISGDSKIPADIIASMGVVTNFCKEKFFVRL